MTAILLDEAEAELERAFEYYETQRHGLGLRLIEEFRRPLIRVLENPNAWQAMGATFRRYRFHRFPYGIVYRIDDAADRIVIVAIMHLSQKPGWWRTRSH